MGKPTKEADILQVLQNIMSGTGIFCQGEGMQKYTILGIKLYDYGAREALRNTDSFLHNGALNTIVYISNFSSDVGIYVVMKSKVNTDSLSIPNVVAIKRPPMNKNKQVLNKKPRLV